MRSLCVGPVSVKDIRVVTPGKQGNCAFHKAINRRKGIQLARTLIKASMGTSPKRPVLLVD